MTFTKTFVEIFYDNKLNSRSGSTSQPLLRKDTWWASPSYTAGFSLIIPGILVPRPLIEESKQVWLEHDQFLGRILMH